MPTISTTCGHKGSCDNLYKNKVIVLDTSFLLHVVDSIERGLSARLSNDQRYESFKYRLNDFLVKLRLCSSDGLIHTTKEVFDNELDSRNPVSSVRTDSSFANLCIENNQNYDEVARMFESSIAIPSSKIPHRETGELNNLVGTIRGTFQRPNIRDLSLFALTIKLAPNQGAILLTDDTGLQRAIDKVCRTRYIRLFGRSLDTTSIGYAFSLTYLEELYKCCKVQKREYWDLLETIYAWTFELEHTSGPTLTLKIYQRLLSRITWEIERIPK